MPIYQDEFWGSNAKVCVTYPINANIALIISNFQQKYVAFIAMRRSGGLSKILLTRIFGAYGLIRFALQVWVGFRASWRGRPLCENCSFLSIQS